MAPKVSAQSGTQPQAPAQSGTQAKAPAQSGTQAKAPAQSGTQAKAPAQSATQPQGPAHSRIESEDPAQSRIEPEDQGPIYLPKLEPSSWINPLCSNPAADCPVCPTGCFCPCILYGKTQSRIDNIHRGEDPLDETKLAPAWHNRWCFTHYFAGCCTSFAGIPCCSAVCTFTQHSRIRETYNIKGSWVSDLAKALCLNQCTLIQAEREVKSRAANDEKLTGSGIFRGPLDSREQRMRYVPRDRLFGDSLEAITSRKSSQPGTGPSSPPSNAVGQPAKGPGLDGATELQRLDPNRVRDVVHQTRMQQIVDQRFHPSIEEVLAASTSAREITPTGAEDASPRDYSPYVIPKIEDQEAVVSESGEAVNNVTLEPPVGASVSAHDQEEAEGEKTTLGKDPIHTECEKPAATTDGADETVYVYYDPTTPQPQKLRDCVKTNFSESTADSKVTGARLEHSSSSDSCSGDETISFVEPSHRAMFRPGGDIAMGSSSNEHISLDTQSTSLSNITENTTEECPSKRSAEGSEDTITIERFNADLEVKAGVDTLKRLKGLQSTPTHVQIDQYFEQGDGFTTLHPKTRESVIQPSTPLALPEVTEEIDVDGEWKVPQDGRFGAMTIGTKSGRKMRPSFFDGNSEP